jgi:hypothetical protein
MQFTQKQTKQNKQKTLKNKIISLSIFLLFLWYWGLNSGPYIYYAGILPLDPLHHPHQGFSTMYYEQRLGSVQCWGSNTGLHADLTSTLQHG